MFKSVFPSLAAAALLLTVVTIPVHRASAAIQWEKSIEKGMKTAAESGKLVMMDFYADW